MTKEKRNALILRWSLRSAGAIALFWGAWYLLTGSMPMVSELKLAPEGMFILPFALPRWSEFLLGPIGSVAVFQTYYLIGRLKEDQQEVAVAGLTSGFMLGLLFGLTYGFVVSLAFSFMYCLATIVLFAIMHGIVASLRYAFIYGIVTILALVLTYSIVSGLVLGLALGAALGFAVALASVLAAVFALVLVIMTVKLCAAPFWCRPSVRFMATVRAK